MKWWSNDRWWGTHSCISDFELSQDVQRHVVMCQRVYNEILIAGWPFFWPVLMTLILPTDNNIKWIQCLSLILIIVIYINRIQQNLQCEALQAYLPWKWNNVVFTLSKSHQDHRDYDQRWLWHFCTLYLELWPFNLQNVATRMTIETHFGVYLK